MTFPRVDLEPLDPPNYPDDTLYLGGRLDTVAGLLERIATAEANIDREISDIGLEIISFSALTPALVTNVVQQHVKLRVRHLIMATPANIAVATLRIGAAQYPFSLQSFMTFVIPFPLVIEPGVDISWTLSVIGTSFAAYIVGRPES
jgi:hypothetical protein